jgi:hypothetical protein
MPETCEPAHTATPVAREYLRKSRRLTWKSFNPFCLFKRRSSV